MARRRPVRYAMSRGSRNILLFVIVFVFLPALVMVDHWAGPPLRRVIERAALYTKDQQKYHGRTFAVADVIDGDTLDLDIPDGDLSVTRVRLLGIDTPETKHPKTGVMYYGPQAAEFTKALADKQKVTILMDTIGDQRDLYGRLLAYIQLEDGRILNEVLIQNGYAYADLRFEHSQSARYEQLMNQAWENKTGLWKEVARRQLPDWLSRKRPLLLR